MNYPLGSLKLGSLFLGAGSRELHFPLKYFVVCKKYWKYGKTQVFFTLTPLCPSLKSIFTFSILCLIPPLSRINTDVFGERGVQQCNKIKCMFELCICEGKCCWYKAPETGLSNTRCRNRIPLNMQIFAMFSRQSQAHSAPHSSSWTHSIFLSSRNMFIFWMISVFFLPCSSLFTVTRRRKWTYFFF